MKKMTRRQALGIGGSIAGVSVLPDFAFAQSALGANHFLSRQIGVRAHDFHFIRTKSTTPSFSIQARNGLVEIRGSDEIALCKGAYRYLFDTGAFHNSWEGNTLNLPGHFPNYKLENSDSPYLHRAYLNPCAFGYSTPFWNWPRWEQEIDYMASRGIDMPLAMEGQEYVWRLLWKEEGLNEAELDAYFCAPPFLPWARMGNIESYFTPTPMQYTLKKRDIQKRILARMRELGMRPILPAFGGYVPHAWAAKKASVKTLKMTPWGGFHETYWLDPNDSNFARLTKRFMELYTQTYGDGEFYLADSFNEMRPPVGEGSDKNDKLSVYGQKIYEAIHAAKPSATWVMQGWLFVSDQDFWTPDSVKAYLKNVPNNRTLILDIGNDYTRDVWRKDNAYSGKAWIFGYIHNFGGNNPLTGDLGLYQSDLSQLPNDPKKGNLLGFGVFPEGINTNSIAYDYMLDMAWQPMAGGLSEWLPHYIRARYGKTNPAIESAWQALIQTAYNNRNWQRAWWRWSFGTYLFTKRPRADFVEFDGKTFDLIGMKAALTQFFALYDDFKSAPLFVHDFVAAIAHWTMLNLDEALITGLKAMKDSHSGTEVPLWPKIKDAAEKLDEVLGVQNQSLANWRKEARAFGDTPAQKDFYEKAALTQVTIWGGDNVLADYASKIWQGLVKDFYMRRWELFFRRADQALSKHVELKADDIKSELARWEHDWLDKPPPIATKTPGNLKTAIAMLLATF